MADQADARKEPGPVPTPVPHKGFPWKTIIVVALLVVLGIFFVRRGHEKSASQGKGPPDGQSSNQPISVVIGKVTEKDVPIYLDGLGTVQAFNTVTVRSRVDGQLIKVAFREGDEVRAGDLLGQIDPEAYRAQVEQMQGKLGQDQAQLENARVELKRDATLLASKIISQEVYDAQAATVKQLEAAIKSDQAAIDSAQVQLNWTKITAPIDGRTGLRLVDEGNFIRAAGDSNGVVLLTQTHPISVVFTLPEQSLGEIQRQQSKGEMKTLAVDRDNRTILAEGTLSVIDNQIDTTTGTIRLKATFSNDDRRLWPGQFVNARLLLDVRTNGIVVPASVIQRGPDGTYAFLVNDDMTVRMAPVKVGPTEQGQTLVESGLFDGQMVVVDGQYKLQPGSKIKPAQAEAAGTNTPSQKREKSGKAPKATAEAGQ